MSECNKVLVVVGSCAVVMATHFVYGVTGGLALNKQCGEKVCDRYYYCNSDFMCDHCSSICDIGTNNYEQNNCEIKCQDYIHDHISSYVNASTFAQLKGTVETLQVLVFLSLTLIVLLLLAIGSVLSIAWYRYRRFLSNDYDKEKAFKSTEIKKKMAVVNTISNNNDAVRGGDNNRLSLKIPQVPVAESELGCPRSAVTTTTPLSTRHPSEDTTLEYAYDNPALIPSPGTNLRRTETTF